MNYELTKKLSVNIAHDLIVVALGDKDIESSIIYETGDIVLRKNGKEVVVPSHKYRFGILRNKIKGDSRISIQELKERLNYKQ